MHITKLPQSMKANRTEKLRHSMLNSANSAQSSKYCIDLNRKHEIRTPRDKTHADLSAFPCNTLQRTANQEFVAKIKWNGHQGPRSGEQQDPQASGQGYPMVGRNKHT